MAADRPPGGGRAGPSGAWVVFTDLDGTLLDDQTYSYDEAAPALEKCRRLGAGVVLASSKT
ncbi:MAG: HAD hydrolase family protein, partial [Deltaproteobacteria bacterium]|nr:HAD hydrolase family protein [Deltaproteobacteria bacterium]